MSRFNIGTGLVLVLALFCLQTQASSFDCKRAASYAEKSICSDSALGHLDEQLSSEYGRALDSTANQNQVRFEQRDWLRLRDNCTTKTCLETSMSDRIKALTVSHTQQANSTYEIDTNRVEQSVPVRPQAPAVTSQHTDVTKPALSSKSEKENHQAVLFLKIGLFCMALLLLICIWLHRRGSMTIYQDYTDALFTSLTPILGVGSYFLFSAWLEIPRNYSIIAACVIGALMSFQVIVQTYRNNGISLFFLLSLFAKLTLLTFYFLLMGLVLFGAGRTKKSSRRWAVLATTVFVFLTGWMCRNRQFSSIDDYIAGRT
jgi:uncharacterized protein